MYTPEASPVHVMYRTASSFVFLKIQNSSEQRRTRTQTTLPQRTNTHAVCVCGGGMVDNDLIYRRLSYVSSLSPHMAPHSDFLAAR